MQSAAKKLDHRQVYQEIGVVVRASDLVEVDTTTGRVHARRATSCLVAPVEGDRVLLAIEERGDAFVLAVLERPEGTRTTLALEGDVTLRASKRLSLSAEETVDVVAGKSVRLAGGAIELTALATRVSTHALTVVSEAAAAALGRVKLVAKSIDSMMDRLTQRAKRAFRFVEGTEQVRARHIDYAASEIANLRGETTVVTARDLVKVNGEQIHVG